MKKNQIDIITLGCSKNLVDSESLMRLFQRKGFVCKHDAERVEGEYVVINTCGFIEDAKQESIDTILEFAQAREEGLIAGLYVMGCLSQRYQKELEAEIPQVDKYYGKFNYKQLLEDLPAPTQKADEKASVKQDTTPSHYSYIKISEGCDRNCAYCAIPIITGKHVSRPKEEILDEVRALVAEGFTSCNSTKKADVPAIDSTAVVDNATSVEQAATDAESLTKDLAEKLAANNPDEVKAIIEQAKQKIAEFIAQGDADAAKAYQEKISAFLTENADKIKSVVGEQNEAVNTLISAITDAPVNAAAAVEGAAGAVEGAAAAAVDEAQKKGQEAIDAEKKKAADAIDAAADDAKKKLGL